MKKRKILFQFILYIGRRKGLINLIEYSYRSEVKLTAFFLLLDLSIHKREEKKVKRGATVAFVRIQELKKFIINFVDTSSEIQLKLLVDHTINFDLINI